MGRQDSVFANINLAGVKVEHGRRSPNQRVENCKDQNFGKGTSATVANEKGTHSGVW
jgi:hypothetical protein